MLAGSQIRSVRGFGGSSGVYADRVPVASVPTTAGILNLQRTNADNARRYRGGLAHFASVAASSTSFTYALWGLVDVEKNSDDRPYALGTGTVVIGSGSAQSPLSGNAADTITFSPSAWFTAARTAFGISGNITAVNSSGGEATLFIGDGLLFDRIAVEAIHASEKLSMSYGVFT
jgi:hypothetical protein